MNQPDIRFPWLLMATMALTWIHCTNLSRAETRSQTRAETRAETQADQPTTASAPNVIMIVVDDLGIGDLSCYGATDLKTPQIDRLIQSGIRFTNAYANCPVCSPTRASLLTGRYPELVGVPGVIRTHPENNWGYLSPECTLLPELLKQKKYRTAAIGKWHLGLAEPNRPSDRGFDFFQGFLGDMMDDYYHHRRHRINYMRKGLVEIDPKGHATELFTKWAQQYIQQAAQTTDPYFLYLAYNAPHTPIQPPPEWFQKVKSREPGISDRRAKLVALIEHLDDGIGQVLMTLKKTDQFKNTMVIFASDNGGQINVGANNASWRDGKQSMYEGGIRVPLGVSWPDRIKPGTQSTEKVISMDLLPTLCKITGAEVPDQVDGVSLSKILLGTQDTLPKRDLFFHRREGGARYGGMITNAIIRGDWKLVRNSPFAPLELYNLKSDPKEQVELSQSHPAKFRELSKALRAQIQRGGAVPWQKSAPSEKQKR